MDKYKSEWQTKKIARAYLEGVRGAIPAAEFQFAVIRKIVLQWSKNPSVILDLGCGDGILGHFLLNVFPSAQGFFVDFSDEMIAAVREKVSSTPKTSVVKADFGSPQWLDSVSSYHPFDIIISGFSIHHQPDDRKKTLFAKIYDLLSPGGVFLNLEHVSSYTPAGEKLFDQVLRRPLVRLSRKVRPRGNERDNRDDLLQPT
jgi:tRNA (cmo5U34)-methyltransferase